MRSSQLGRLSYLVACTAGGLIISASAQAVSGISYEGKLLQTDGVTPVADGAVELKFEIRSPGTENCLLYLETKTVAIPAVAGGNFATSIDGSGSRIGDPTLFNLDRVFSNRTSFTGLQTCGDAVSTSYSPAAADNRKLVMSFKTTAMGAFETFPAQAINHAPMAIDSLQISGFNISSLLRVADGGVLGNVTPLSNANYTELLSLINGTSAVYEKAGKLQGGPLPVMTSGQVLGWSGSAWTSIDPIASVQTFAKTALPVCSAGQFLKDNGSGLLTCATPTAGGAGTLTSISTGTGLTGGSITTSGTISIAAGGVSSAELASNAVTSAKIQDGTISSADLDTPTLSAIGAVNAASTASLASTIVKRDAASYITSAGFTLYNAGSNLNLVSPIGSNWTMTLPQNQGTSGSVLTTNGSGVTTWAPPALAPADGVAAFPGLSFASHTNTGLFMSTNDLGFSTQGMERMRINSAGNVGIGTATPAYTLDVAGVMNATSIKVNGVPVATATGAAYVSSTTSIDFASAPVQMTSAACGAFQLNNLKDGQVYRLLIKGSTSSPCTFTSYSGAGTGTLTTKGANASTFPSTPSKYNQATITVYGSEAIINWDSNI